MISEAYLVSPQTDLPTKTVEKVLCNMPLEKDTLFFISIEPISILILYFILKISKLTACSSSEISLSMCFRLKYLN